MTPSARSRLAPQLEDYDRLGQAVSWRPYLMFFQPPGFRSSAVNTDADGFRISHGPDGRPMALPLPEQQGANLLLGNSVAFGVGATSDAGSLASRLAAHTGEDWINGCGRAHASFQESLVLQAYRHRFGRIRTIVVCSGLNDLYLYFSPKIFDPVFGSFFYSEAFRQLERPRRDRVGTLLDAVAAFTRRRKPARDEAPTHIREVVAERMAGRDALLEVLGRNMATMTMIARGLGARLVYALQPMHPWLDRVGAPEEEALIAEQDASGSHWHEIVKQVLVMDVYRWYRQELQGICDRLEIPFLDLNADFNDGALDSRWLFLDRVHLTDEGNDLTARLIARRIGDVS